MPAAVKASSLLAEKWLLGLVGALCIGLFAMADLPWHLDDYDQAKQAFVSFEMMEQGHWLYQHTPNGWVATKPPLEGWISAALFALTRSWELAWRLPSLAAACALLVLLGRAARGFGPAAVLLATSAFGLNLFTPRLATLVRTDMLLALIIFLIGWRIEKKLREGSAWMSRDRWVIFALVTAGLFVKGPIIYVFLLPGMALFQWCARRRGASVTAWCGWWPWLASLALFLLWTAGGILFVPEFWEHVVQREFGGRFELNHRAQPFYFYLAHLLKRFAPWSVLLLGWSALTVYAQRKRVRDLWSNIRPETLWLICWSVGGLAVMSVIPSKRIDRIFPIVPPLCLLLVAQFAYLQGKAKSPRRPELWVALAVVLAALFHTGYTMARSVSAHRQHRDAFAVFGRAVRAEVAAHHWRYAVIGGEDEGMLLYLRQTEFVEPERAIADWKAGALDAVVAPEEELPELTRDLAGAVPSSIGLSGAAGDQKRRYVLLTRIRATESGMQAAP